MSDTRDTSSQDQTIKQLRALIAELIYAHECSEQDDPPEWATVILARALEQAEHPDLEEFLKPRREGLSPWRKGLVNA